jgi:bifunctional DNA-binding transcriptional regulator/antitoxin component of YhaV-PrlF toxin-antitoxin module
VAQDLKIVSVTFQINAQYYIDGRFTIPKEVRDILGVDHDNVLTVVIETDSQTFAYTEPMVSGHEYYGEEIRKRVKAGQRLRITAYHP